MSASTLRYEPRDDGNEGLHERLKELAGQHRRHGYRMLNVHSDPIPATAAQPRAVPTRYEPPGAAQLSKCLSQSPMSATEKQIREAISQVLMERPPPATACPSEVARALAPHDWRTLMHQVCDVALAMAREGALEIRQGGITIIPDGAHSGPIRLGRRFR